MCKNFMLFLLSVSASAEGKKSNLTAIATWRGEPRQTPRDILGTPSMGKAMEPWCRWRITRIGGETNGWALDTHTASSRCATH